MWQYRREQKNMINEDHVQQEIEDTLARIDADLTRIYAMLPLRVVGAPQGAELPYRDVIELCEFRSFQILRGEARDGQ